MKKGEQIVWDGVKATVEGFTADGLSVVAVNETGERIYLPVAPFNAFFPFSRPINGPATTCAVETSTSACVGRGEEKVSP